MYLWKLLRGKFLYVIWLCAAGLPMVGLNWVEKHHPQLLPSPVMWVIMPVYLFYCVGSFYIVAATSHHMDTDPALSFWGAVKRSYAGWLLLLRSVPIIGSLFEADEDKTHYDPDDE